MFSLSLAEATSLSEGQPLTIGKGSLSVAQKDFFRHWGVKFEIHPGSGGKLWEPRTWHERLLTDSSV